MEFFWVHFSYAAYVSFPEVWAQRRLMEVHKPHRVERVSKSANNNDRAYKPKSDPIKYDDHVHNDEFTDFFGKSKKRKWKMYEKTANN